MKYRIITEEHAATLETAVNEAMGEDWQPIGGVTVVCYEESLPYDYEQKRIWAQAMVRYSLSEKLLAEVKNQ